MLALAAESVSTWNHWNVFSAERKMQLPPYQTHEAFTWENSPRRPRTCSWSDGADAPAAKIILQGSYWNILPHTIFASLATDPFRFIFQGSAMQPQSFRKDDTFLGQLISAESMLCRTYAFLAWHQTRRARRNDCSEPGTGWLAQLFDFDSGNSLGDLF